MKKKIFAYIFFFMFQMFGAFISGYAGNYIMVGWCTGWAAYAVVQLEKLAKQNKPDENMDIGD